MFWRPFGMRQTLVMVLVICLCLILIGQEAASMDEARAVFVVA